MINTDVVSDFNITGGLPKGAARRALDPDIAGEGGKVVGDPLNTRVILANGDQVAWTPPPEKLIIPDLSNVKSLRHYFGSRGHQVYPAWLYHKDGRSLLAKDSKEAGEVGIVFRQATQDERNRYGLKTVWDWEEDCLWRPNPWAEPKFDPANPGAGKEVVYKAPDPKIAQHALISDLIPAVAEAVARSLKANGPAAPANVDPAQWEQFLEFAAFKKAQEAVTQAAAEVIDPAFEEAQDELLTPEDRAANALSPEQDRFVWEAEATRLGIKVDKRWGADRLKAEIEKVSKAS